MPLFDLPLSELETLLPERHEPDDFRTFWDRTLGGERAADREVELGPHALSLPLVEVHDLSFAGFGGHRVHGWFLHPAGRAPRASGWPTVVQYLG